MTAPGRIEGAVLTACPCCGGGLSEPFYETGPVPVHSCLMLDSAEAARSFPTGMVRLALCVDCGFVANIAFDPAWSAYAPSYEDQQSFSPAFNSFAGGLARGLVERHALHGKRAVEIGCSKGDFMALLCEIGGMDTIGIDPSVVEGRVARPSQGSMRFVADYYGETHLDLPADLICCRHTLEHIQPVHRTLRLMRDHAERAGASVVCIEVPDAARLWRDFAFEDIYYEHCSYFTAGALAAAVRRAGFAVIDLRREYDGQYLVIEAALDPSRDRAFDIEEPPARTAADIARFQRGIGPVIHGWRDILRREAEAGRRPAIWGSGSKCVAFLRTLGVSGSIAGIVDINPHRAGKYAPGLQIPIGSPASLGTLRADRIIAMNDIYLREIRAACGNLGVAAEASGLAEVTTAIAAGREREVWP
jgi:hypothetical protein